MAELSPEENLIREHLEKLGATLRKEYYTGNNSYPTEYTITYKNMTVIQPALELALVALIEQLANRP
jgi:hypothetical protein